VIEALDATPSVEVCGVARHWGEVEEGWLRLARFVVVALDEPGLLSDDCWNAVATHAHLRVLGLTAGGDGWIFELEPRARPIGPVTPASVGKLISVRSLPPR
jgi:hypothetical protein